jgi:hypothetical protein
MPTTPDNAALSDPRISPAGITLLFAGESVRRCYSINTLFFYSERPFATVPRPTHKCYASQPPTATAMTVSLDSSPMTADQSNGGNTSSVRCRLNLLHGSEVFLARRTSGLDYDRAKKYPLFRWSLSRSPFANTS